jgi:hypothetical protein
MSTYVTTARNTLLGAAALGTLVFALSPPVDQLNTYYGLFHAHTMISDGSGTPEEAFAMAKQQQLDFFAITEHNHDKAEDGAKDRKDGVLIGIDHNFYNGAQVQTVTVKGKSISFKPLLLAAKDATDNKFVAIYGQEFSTISSSNHINVLGIDEVITVPNGDVEGLVTLVKRLKASGKPVPILQFNHPDVQTDLFYKGNDASTKKNMKNDYGIDAGDLGPNFQTMVDALDPYVEMIEVLSGPALSDKAKPNFRYSSNEDDYFFYLSQGFHVSPSVGQDNHYKTWGSITEARTGILASALTKDAIFEAIRNHRTFASEDKNLSVKLYLNDKIMGSNVVAGENSELRISVIIDDKDEPNASYKISVYGGELSPQLSTGATNWKASDGLLTEFETTGNGTFTNTDVVAQKNPFFYYIKVEQDGSDRLWTSPVWVNDGTAPLSPIVVAVGETFYWSKSPSSKVYHKEGCVSVSQIKADNLISGSSPPSGRTLHECHVAETIEH